jgi:Ca2+-binding RTX toxin-like protein
MANVTFLQATDMSLLPTSLEHTSAVHFGGVDRTAWTGSFNVDEAYYSLLGTFTFQLGPAPVASADVTTAAFDSNDNDFITNILIQNITVGPASSALLDAINTDNQPGMVQALLAGGDSITGSPGADGINGFGGNDLVHAGGGGDTVDGGDGSDTLFGEAGNDRLAGGSGTDVLIGGAGADKLYANAFSASVDDGARDFFRFTALSDSGTTAATRDEVFGFARGAGLSADRIDLSRIDADPSLAGNQAFHIVSAFTPAHGEVRLVYSGADTLIQVDGDTDPAVDMTILVHNAHLHAVDLIL